jgi:hypothetical protein
MAGRTQEQAAIERFGEAMRAAERYEVDGPEPGPPEVRELLRRLADAAAVFPLLADRVEATVGGQHESGELRRPAGAPVAASVSLLEAALLEARVCARDLHAALERAGSAIADVELIDEW